MRDSILVADDEKSVRDGLRTLFQAAGFDVAVARNGEECLAKFTAVRPSLVLLDVMMPKMDGFSACVAIRRLDGQVPIVFLTAKDATEDEVRALSLGADDFISKSDDPVVLLARIRRILTRLTEADTATSDQVLNLGSVVVDLANFFIVEGSRRVKLTRTQADILRLLMQAPGHMLSKEEMLFGLRGQGYVCTDGAVYTHIYNLRERLGSAAKFVDCKSRVGYRLKVGT